MKKMTAAVVGMVLSMAVLGGWAYTHAEGSVVTICIKQTGLVHVIGEGFKRADCKNNEQLITFNTQGVQGIKGDKGDKGDRGDPGTSNWDETRISTLEARVAALENPPVPEPTTCTAVLCENFNSYTDGAIVGKNGWFDRESGTFYLVEGDIKQEGEKALSNHSNLSNSIITKNSGTALADGRQSLYVKTENRSGWGDYNRGENVQIGLFQGSWDGPSRTAIAFMKDGHVALSYGGVGYVNFDTYIDGTWTLVDIEWRTIDQSARYRVNNGVWTDWTPIVGASSFTGFDTVGIVTFTLGSGGVYFDDLH
jgi:hypothetical protein